MIEPQAGEDVGKMIEGAGFSPEQELIKFNQKAAGATLNVVLRILSTLTEPFFRRDMGERYYTKETHRVGMLFWLVTPVVCYYFPKYSSLTAALLDLAKNKYHVDLTGAEEFLQRPAGSIIVGILLVLLQWMWGGQSIQLMKQYRNQVKAYHTRSRGVSRWGNQNRAAAIVILAVLFTFNLPAGIIFFVGMAINLKQKADQDAAIMSHYFDALDKKVEEEFLRDAAVNKCPIELTYLNHAIDPGINPEVRENIADALVGQPVEIFGDDSDTVTPAPQPRTQPRPARTQERPVARPAESQPTERRQAATQEPVQEVSNAVFIAPRNVSTAQSEQGKPTPANPKPTPAQKSEEPVPMTLHTLSKGVMTEFSVGTAQYKVPLEKLINDFVGKGIKVTLSKPHVQVLVERGGKGESLRLQEVIDYFVATKQRV